MWHIGSIYVSHWYHCYLTQYSHFMAEELRPRAEDLPKLLLRRSVMDPPVPFSFFGLCLTSWYFSWGLHHGGLLSLSHFWECAPWGVDLSDKLSPTPQPQTQGPGNICWTRPHRAPRAGFQVALLPPWGLDGVHTDSSAKHWPGTDIYGSRNIYWLELCQIQQQDRRETESKMKGKGESKLL